MVTADCGTMASQPGPARSASVLEGPSIAQLINRFRTERPAKPAERQTAQIPGSLSLARCGFVTCPKKSSDTGKAPRKQICIYRREVEELVWWKDEKMARTAQESRFPDAQQVPSAPAVDTFPAASALLDTVDGTGVSAHLATHEPVSAVAEQPTRVEALLKLAESCPPLFEVCHHYLCINCVRSESIKIITAAWCYRRCKQSN